MFLGRRNTVARCWVVSLAAGRIERPSGGVVPRSFFTLSCKWEGDRRGSNPRPSLDECCEVYL